MKRMIALLLAVLMVLSLAACGNKAKKAESANEAPADAAVAEQAAEEPGMTAGEEAAANAAAAEAEAGTEAEAGAPADNGYVNYTSIDELNNALGSKIGRFSDDSVSDESFQTVNENGVDIAQYVCLANGIPFGVRFSPDFEASISGATKEDGTDLLEGVEDETVVEYENCLVTRFVTVDGQYVVIAGTTDESIFNNALSQIRATSVGEDAE